MAKRLFVSAFFAAASVLPAFAGVSDAEFYKYTNYNPDAPSSAPKYEDFLNPSGKSRPQTWWHWIEGNVSKEGIDADLKAMSENGYGAAIIFNIGANCSNRMRSKTAPGPLVFNSPEWFETFKYAVQKGSEYGVDIGIHNCDGWSEAGGPWITPENSMKTLSWTVLKVDGGGARELKLPKPHANMGFYNDIAVIAWPNVRPDSAPMLSALESIRPATPETAAFGPIKGWSGKAFEVRADKKNFKSFGFLMEFGEPFEAGMLALEVKRHWSLPKPLVLEVSDDGKNFRKVADVKFKTAEALVKFPAAKAKYWRLVRTDNTRDWENNADTIGIRALELVPEGGVPSKMPLVQAQLAKVNMIPHRSATSMPLPYDDMEVPEKAVIDRKDVRVFKNALGDDGSFKWDFPAGRWNVMRLGYTTSGRRVHPATKGGVGLEIDKMSAKAVDAHFDSYIKKMIDAAGDGAGKVFKYVETDSWECGNQSWTENLDKLFKKENGYDMLKFVPTFVGDCVDGKEQTEAFGSDLRALTSKLVMENFYGRLGERIRGAGLLYESEPAAEAFMNDPMYGFKVSDIPQHEIWQNSRRINGVNGARFATEGPGRWCNVPSAAHFYGKELTTCESLSQGDGNWTDCPASLKGTSDTIVLSGYNVMVFHSYTHQPDERVPGWQMEPWGSVINRKMPWFKLSRPFFDYLARIQYMTQKGKAGSRILNFVSDRVPVENGSIDAPENVEIDMVNGDGVRNYLRVENGKFVSPGRMEYDLMSINKDRFLRLDTLKKLKEYVEAGASIAGYFYGGRYDTLVGGKRAEREWNALNKELFGGPEKSVRKIGKGTVYANYSTREAAEAMGIKPSFICRDSGGKIESSAKAWGSHILWAKRLHRDGTVWYWVLNATPQTRRIVASFDVAGMDASVWNPETGERYVPAAVSEAGGYTSVPLTLPAHSNAFVVFENSKKNPRIKSYSIGGSPRFPEVSDVSGDAAANNFSLAFTVSPKSDLPELKEQNGGIISPKWDVDAIPAQGMHLSLGDGHTGVGALAGKNGVAVIEHGANYRNAVLVHNAPIADNTRVAVVYRDGVPNLYLNGKFAKSGLKSPRIPHPSRAAGRGFSGYVDSVFVSDKPFGDAEAASDAAGTSVGKREIPDIEPVPFVSEDGRIRAEFFRNGKIDAELADGSKLEISAGDVPEPTEIRPPYEVEFDEKLGGPERAKFNAAESWTENSDPRIKHYSGVAKYSMFADVAPGKLGDDKKAYIDFAKVGDVARVWVNGKLAGSVWKSPYRLEITKFLKPGRNKIEAEVGNVWANRCLYDATLPPEKRITWGNAMWFHYPEAGSGQKGTWTQGPIPAGIYGGMPLILHSVVK